MPKSTRSQQRAQRNMRILLIVISLMVVLAMVLSLLPAPS